MPRNTQWYGSADLGREGGSKDVDLEGAGVGLANMQRFPSLPTAYLPYFHFHNGGLVGAALEG